MKIRLFICTFFTHSKTWILVTFLAIFCFTHLYSEDILLSKKALKIVSNRTDESPYFKSSIGMKYHEGHLYYVANPYHKILKFKYSGDLIFKKSIGRKGQGPGDLFLPIGIKTYKGNLVVSDNNKISFFDASGKFIRNFNHFSVGTEFLVQDDKVFLLSPKPQKETLIKVYSLVGKMQGYAGKKFLSPDSKARNIYLQEQILYKGILLNNGDNVDYISQLFGVLQKIDKSGEIVFTKDISGVFSELLLKRKERNEKMFLKGEFKFSSRGPLRIPTIPLFRAACVKGDYIYFLGPNLTTKEYREKKFVEIRAVNKTSLKLHKVYKFFLDHNEDSIKLFDIKDINTDGRAVFLALVDTEAAGYVFFELSEKEFHK